MNLIKSEKIENGMVELQFSIDAESFRDATAAVFKRDGKKYKVQGFREGKAPRALIEKMYGAEVFTYDAINDLFPTHYEAALTEAGVEIVGPPQVDVVSASETDGVVLTVKVAEMPVATVKDYKGLAVEKSTETVADEAVDAEITRMLERNARECTREGKTEMGDILDLDFAGSVDGVLFDGGTAEHHTLTLGSNSFIPGFEEQCVGYEAGAEFDVKVSFPEEYHAPELAGKEAVFAIKLHGAKYKELPELDDEFAKDVSEYDTVAELKDSIRKNQQEQMDKQAELDMENALVDMVIENMECEVPAVMYESRMDEMVNDFGFRVQQQGLDLDTYLQYMGQTMEQFRETMMPQAEKQVKIRLALTAVAKAENIEISEEDINAEIARIAEQYKMEEDKVRNLVNVEDLKKDMSVTKAIDFIKENAKVGKKAAKKAPAKKATKKAEDKEAAPKKTRKKAEKPEKTEE